MKYHLGPPLASLSPRLHPKSTLHFELANFAKITLSILNSRPGWKMRAEILKFANLEFHQKVRKLGENDDFISIGIPIGILLFFCDSTSLRSRERISLSFFFLIEAIGISAWRLFCSVTRSNVIRCQSNYNYNGDVKRMRKIKCILIVSLRNKILNDDENEKSGFWIV